MIRVLESCRSLNHYFFESFVIQYNYENRWHELGCEAKIADFDNPTHIRVLEETRKQEEHPEEGNGKDKKGKDKKKEKHDKHEKKKGKGKEEKDKDDGKMDSDDKDKGKDKENGLKLVPVMVQRRYVITAMNLYSPLFREKIQYVGINLKQASQLELAGSSKSKEAQQLNPYVVFSWASAPDEKWRSLTKTGGYLSPIFASYHASDHFTRCC